MKSVHDLKEARDLRGLSKLLSHPVLATRVDVARALRDLRIFGFLWARTDFVKYANQPLEGWEAKASFGSIKRARRCEG